MASRNRILFVIIPVVAIAVGLLMVFALPLASSSPPQEVEESEQYDCTTPAAGINYLIIEMGGEGTSGTRRQAASVLMDRFCNTAGFLQEISGMAYPSIGLVSYGCDVTSGSIEDSHGLKSVLTEYQPIYCEAATLGVLERAEFMGLAVHDFEEEIAAYIQNQKDTFDYESENTDTGPDPNIQVIDTKYVDAEVSEIRNLIKSASDLASERHYFEATKTLENANARLIQLSSDAYSS